MQIHIPIKEKINLIESVFGNGPLSNNGKNITVKCPSCNIKSGTKKKKLSICLETGIYHCWVCEAKGKNISSLIKQTINDTNIIKKSMDMFGCSKLKEDKKNEILNLPGDFKLIQCIKGSVKNYALKYLFNRGILDKSIQKYKIGLSSQSEYVNRLIFPSFSKDLNLNFYVTRTYEKNQFLKYKNCNVNKKNIIFNEYMIDWKKPLIVVEGVFDAMKVEGNVVPLLGSWMDESYLLYQEIVKNKTPTILCLDDDAHAKTIKIAKSLSSYGIDIKLSQHSNKDFGSMNKNETQFYISEAISYDNMSRIRYLIDEIKSGSIY